MSARFEEIPQHTSFARRWAQIRGAMAVLIYQQLLWLYSLLRQWQP